MINRYAYKDLTWVDLESPTADEVRQIMEEYEIDPLVGQQLLTPSIKPKVDAHGHFLFVILHFPALRHSHSKDQNQEIDFLVGKEFIITTRYDSIDPLHEFSKIFEVNSILNKDIFGEHAGYIFYSMVEKLYASIGQELDSIDGSLHAIEEEIFAGKEKRMVIELSRASRDLLDLREGISLHKEVLHSLLPQSKQFFDEKFSQYLGRIVDEYYKVHTEIDSRREYMRELRETNDSLLETKQNEIMKIFTIMAFFTFPLALLVSILTIESPSNPIRGAENEFWIIIGIVLAGLLSMYSYFRFKKWL